MRFLQISKTAFVSMSHIEGFILTPEKTTLITHFGKISNPVEKGSGYYDLVLAALKEAKP